MAVVDAEEVPDHVPDAAVLEQVAFLQFSNHADDRVRQRDGFSFPVVEEMIFGPVGEVFYDVYRRAFVIVDWDRYEQPRAVVVAVQGLTATVITAYLVEDAEKYSVDQYVPVAEYP